VLERRNALALRCGLESVQTKASLYRELEDESSLGEFLICLDQFKIDITVIITGKTKTRF
jgi:hypothetical protein